MINLLIADHQKGIRNERSAVEHGPGVAPFQAAGLLRGFK
jgi:hypothetical protein